jgi:ankyrin repeat protein
LIAAAGEGHGNIVWSFIERGTGFGVRDIEGKTAIDIATVKDHTAFIPVLKDRAEGTKLLNSILLIYLNTDSEIGNIERFYL